MSRKAAALAGYEAGHHVGIEQLSRDIIVELSMCELANEDASKEWLEGYQFAHDRVLQVIAEWTDKEEKDVE